MKKAVFILLSFLSIFLAVNPGDSIAACNYQVALYDSFGDGWNGGLLSVYVAGVPVLSNITLGSGSGPEYHSFSVEAGDEISTVYTAGAWANEPSYTIIGADLNPVVTDGADGGQNTIPSGLSGIIAVCPQMQSIPTLSEWGMVLMSLLLGGSALWMIRRRTS